MSGFKNVIFDLGGVIIHLDIDRSAHEFQKLIPPFDFDTFVGKQLQLKLYSEYECGLISTDDFFTRFKQHYQTDISFSEFKRCWNAMILKLPKENIEFLNYLRKAGKSVFLLSNINPIHAEYVELVYEGLMTNGSFRSHFNRAYYSYEMGMRKPNAEIYAYLLKEHALNPTETVFIDDNRFNIESAASLGIQVIHFANPDTLCTLKL